MGADSAGMISHKIRVLAADDHLPMREATRVALGQAADLEVLGAVEPGEAAVERVRTLGGAVDVVLMDVQMPGIGGLVATAQINAEYPWCRVVLFTSVSSYATAGQRMGAFGYLLKVAGWEEVEEAIRAVHQGRRCFAVAPEGGAVLSETEVKILDLMAWGVSDFQIAQQLGRSEDVVVGHLRNTTAKLGAHGREHAAAIAIRRGIIR